MALFASDVIEVSGRLQYISHDSLARDFRVIN